MAKAKAPTKIEELSEGNPHLAKCLALKARCRKSLGGLSPAKISTELGNMEALKAEWLKAVAWEQKKKS